MISADVSQQIWTNKYPLLNHHPQSISSPSNYEQDKWMKTYFKTCSPWALLKTGKIWKFQLQNPVAQCLHMSASIKIVKPEEDQCKNIQQEKFLQLVKKQKIKKKHPEIWSWCFRWTTSSLPTITSSRLQNKIKSICLHK